MRFLGRMAIYFNRHGAAPLVWCICPSPRRPTGSHPSWEIAVRDIEIDGTLLRSVYSPKATPDDEDGMPSAWFEVDGALFVNDLGVATIKAAP